MPQGSAAVVVQAAAAAAAAASDPGKAVVRVSRSQSLRLSQKGQEEDTGGRRRDTHVPKMLMTAVGSVTAIFGVCVMAALFQCCCRRKRSSSSSGGGGSGDDDDEGSLKKGQQKEERERERESGGGGRGSRSKSPSPHKVLPGGNTPGGDDEEVETG